IRKVNEDPPADFPQFNIYQNGETAPGYLFGGSKSDNPDVGAYSIIMDNDGTIIHWQPNELASFDLQPNGLISYGLPAGGKNEAEYFVMNSDFENVDSYQMGNGYIADSHDFLIMENGHALMFGLDIQVVDMSQIVDGGNPEAQVTGAIIQELDVNKNVIFQWRSWDYIPITDTYRDITKNKIPYIHVNSLEIDNDGHILFIGREISTVVKINRQSGDVMWKLGGKHDEFTYIGEHEEYAPNYFFMPHSVRRWANGNITLFDNGADKNNPIKSYSRAVEYQLDEVNKTATLVWEFRHDPDILALSGGTVQRLENGNTLISWGGAIADGAPAVTEVQPDGTVVYELTYTETDVKGGFTRHAWDEADVSDEVMVTEIDEGNTYDFTDGENVTGVSIKVSTFSGDIYNELIVNKTSFSPVNPEFPGQAPVVYPFRVTIETRFINTFSGIVEFDINELNITNPDDVLIYYREFPNAGLFIPLPTTYNFVTGKLRAIVNTLGEFILGYPNLEVVSYAPMLLEPADANDVNQTLPVDFTWAPVGSYESFDLQVATDAAFQNLVIDETNLTGVSYSTPDPLDVNTTYHWRVRNNNSAGASDWSTSQSFNTVDEFITVVSPNGSEQWHVGLEYFIEWDDNIDGNVFISLLKNDVNVLDIATTGSDSYFEWEVDLTLEPGDDYKIQITSVDDETLLDISDALFSIIDTVSSVIDDAIPTEYSLNQNYPNPFNPSTTISYSLPVSGKTKLVVYDLLGNEIETLINAEKHAGHHEVVFNANNLSSGIYLYLLTSGDYSVTKKMVLLK
ncbi:aryl-sulfate sulfotransferase, partial [Bacteroidota bacterium]